MGYHFLKFCSTGKRKLHCQNLMTESLETCLSGMSSPILSGSAGSIGVGCIMSCAQPSQPDVVVCLRPWAAQSIHSSLSLSSFLISGEYVEYFSVIYIQKRRRGNKMGCILLVTSLLLKTIFSTVQLYNLDLAYFQLHFVKYSRKYTCNYQISPPCVLDQKS